MSEFLKNLLLNMVLPLLENEGKKFLIEKLQKIHDENPRLHAGIVIGGHLAIEGIVADLVAKTETKIDDKVVADLKEVLETSASANGITIPTLPPPPAAAPVV